MDFTRVALESELQVVLSQINVQTLVLQKEAERVGAPTIFELRTPDGNYPMVDLLLAKAQALHGLAVLKGERK